MTEEERKIRQEKLDKLLALYNEEEEENNEEEIIAVEETNEEEKANALSLREKLLSISCGIVSLLLIMTSLSTCGRKNNNSHSSETSIVETTEAINYSFDLEENIKKNAEIIFNSIDQSIITFTLEDVEDTIRFLNGIKTNKTYSDIELLDMIDNVLYNGMDTYYGSLANTIGGVTPINENVHSINWEYLFENNSLEQVVIYKFDSILNQIVANQGNKEELNKLANELLTLEVMLLESKIEVNGKYLSIDDFSDGAKATLYSIMDQNDRILKAIGGNNFSVTLDIVNDVEGTQTETYSAKYIINKINKKDCVVYTPEGEEVPMDDHDNTLINLLKLQESLQNNNTLKLTNN